MEVRGTVKGAFYVAVCLVCAAVDILSAFPVTMRLLANMAHTATSGLSRPAAATGMATVL
jgi:hypothetical protein